MFDPIDFDPALAGLWPPGGDQLWAAAAPEPWLETKAQASPASQAPPPSPADDLQALLNAMTTEMRLQFEAFRKIRQDAEARLAEGDEAEQKLAKADIKSATDALSLIVRTIEKIDSLQRSLAHDRETALERQCDEAAFQQLLADTERQIAARVEEQVAERLAATAPGSGDPVAVAVEPTGPPGS